MKKTIVFTVLGLMLLTACASNEEIAPNTFTQTYRIYADDMTERRDATGIYFEYTIDEPNLTNEVFNYGIMQAFLYYTKDGRDTASPLPFSDFLTASDGYQWEEQFTVEFQPRRIKFIQKISDHSDEAPLAAYYDVLVRFLW
jgi:hypothetical protein